MPPVRSVRRERRPSRSGWTCPDGAAGRDRVGGPEHAGRCDGQEQQRRRILAAFTTPLPIPKLDPPQRSRLMNKPEAELTVEEKYLRGPETRSRRRIARGPASTMRRPWRMIPGTHRRCGRWPCSTLEAALYESADRTAAKGRRAGSRRRPRLVLPGRDLSEDAAMRKRRFAVPAGDPMHRDRLACPRSGRPGPCGAGRAPSGPRCL